MKPFSKTDLKKKLTGAFLAVAAIGTGGSLPIATAHADFDVAVTAAVTAATAVTGDEISGRGPVSARAIYATNAVIVDPSTNNIRELANSEAIPATQIPYVKMSAGEMKLPKGLLPEDVTDAQRAEFRFWLKRNQWLAIMSSATPKEADEKGLNDINPNYFFHFNDCKAELKIPPGQVRNEKLRSRFYQCLDDKEHSRKNNVLLVGLLGLAGVAGAAGLGAYVSESRRRKHEEKKTNKI